ncbi:hypothetical protein [Nostoc sp. DedSLP04]|nr:hypothetical protein [Nostoc sp. DedSLP04]MDZ8031541.1 hypothetical protein [Nostoc sp. DedSLP04]
MQDLLPTQIIHKFYLSIVCDDRTDRTTLKSDRISFCQKVVMLRLNVVTLSLNLMMLVINVVTLSLKVIALSLKVITLRLKVIALSLKVIALRLNVVMLVTTRHSLITAIVDSGTILQPVPSFESQPEKPKRQTKIKALQGWFEKTQPTPSDFDPDQARWEALKEKHNL